MPESANIAFAWDSTDVMNIEYRIPLSFFGTLSSDQKDVSIGWKINGLNFPQTIVVLISHPQVKEDMEELMAEVMAEG
jgi:hypothetical protein